MTTTTIPENPKPGERYMRKSGTWASGERVVSPDLWDVFDPTRGIDSRIGRALPEADARLLTFGGAAVAALREALPALRLAAAELGGTGYFASKADAAQRALANFPE